MSKIIGVLGNQILQEVHFQKLVSRENLVLLLYFSGICSAVGNAVSWPASVAGVESAIIHYQAELEKLVNIGKSVIQNIDDLNETMEEAIDFLENEMAIIFKWEISAENVNNKIALFSVEELKQFAGFQKVFVRGVDELMDVAQNYLDRPEVLYEKQIRSDLVSD